MKFFLDENFPKTVDKLISSVGHKIIDIRETRETGLSDLEIFKLAQKNKAIFLTTDLDFFHTIPFHFPQHHGVIIIALNQPNRAKILEKFKWSLFNLNLTNLANQIILLRDNSYTIKK